MLSYRLLTYTILTVIILQEKGWAYPGPVSREALHEEE